MVYGRVEMKYVAKQWWVVVYKWAGRRLDFPAIVVVYRG